MIHESGVDRIELKEKPTDDRYPEVFMEISQEGVDPKTTAERIQTERKNIRRLNRIPWMNRFKAGKCVPLVEPAVRVG